MIFNYSTTPITQDFPVILSKRPEIGANSLLFSISKNSRFRLLFQAKNRKKLLIQKIATIKIQLKKRKKMLAIPGWESNPGPPEVWQLTIPPSILCSLYPNQAENLTATDHDNMYLYGLRTLRRIHDFNLARFRADNRTRISIAFECGRTRSRAIKDENLAHFQYPAQW